MIKIKKINKDSKIDELIKSINILVDKTNKLGECHNKLTKLCGKFIKHYNRHLKVHYVKIIKR